MNTNEQGSRDVEGQIGSRIVEGRPGVEPTPAPKIPFRPEGLCMGRPCGVIGLALKLLPTDTEALGDVQANQQPGEPRRRTDGTGDVWQ